MGKYAANTEVSVDRSQAEIQTIIRKYGAERFMSGWEEKGAFVVFQKNGKMIRFFLPLPDRNDPQFCDYMQGSVKYSRKEEQAEKLWEQACRQRWRALALAIKAKMETVECGIATFENEFLAYIVVGPQGQTVGDQLAPQLDAAIRSGRMPQLLLTGPAGKNHDEKG